MAPWGENVDSAALSMDSSGVLHVAWRTTDSESVWIDYSQSDDNGASWSDPVEVYWNEYGWNSVLKDSIGLVTDSQDRIYITYNNNPYLYMVHSDDGTSWTEPSSPYTGGLPLGHHQTQPFPVMDSNDVLYLFFLSKNDQWQFGSLSVVTWE